MWISLAEGAGPVATIESDLSVNGGGFGYRLSFVATSAMPELVSESLLDVATGQELFQRDGREFSIGGDTAGNAPLAESVFAFYKDPRERLITPVGRTLSEIRIYRQFLTTGRYAQSRFGIVPSGLPLRRSTLQDGGDNLALVLHELDFRGFENLIGEYLRKLNDRFSGVKVKVEQVAQTYLQETGLIERLPATRMSDGTLKFLCLLAVLLDPDVPPLLCIEEPEVGLHPEAIQIVADLLIEASEKTQIVVTTHSESLVDAMSDRPESVLVCERDFDNGTQLRQLDSKQLRLWLKRYTLGQLWRKGEIGGTRW